MRKFAPTKISRYTVYCTEDTQMDMQRIGKINKDQLVERVMLHAHTKYCGLNPLSQLYSKLLYKTLPNL